MERIVFLIVMAVCQGPLHGEGVMFFLRDEPVGTTNSSVCLNITDVGDSAEDGVVCQSSLSHANLTSGDWYLSGDGLANSTDEENRIVMDDRRGWTSDVVQTNDSDGHLLVRLWRVSESAVDGTFTCDIPGDTNSPRTLYIFSHSTAVTPVNVRVEEVSATNITIRWDDPRLIWLTCSGLAGYRVQWTAVPGGENQYHKAQGLSEAHLSGLTPFSKYSIAVAAVNKEGQVMGPYSEPLIVQMDEDTPGPVVIVPVPSLVQIAITWSEPAMPNGIITDYEVSFGPKNFSRPTIANTGLVTNFSVRVKLGDEFIFTVRAFTRAGAGEPTTVLVSTIAEISVVEGVTVTSLDGSSANVSWTALDVPFLPVTYTVVYSCISHSPMEEKIAVFLPPAKSGVITGLRAQATYQIQVFATVTASGVEIVGEKSSLVYFANGVSSAPPPAATQPLLSILLGIMMTLLLCVTVFLAILVPALYRRQKRRSTNRDRDYLVTSAYKQHRHVLRENREGDLLEHLWDQLENNGMIYSKHQLKLSTPIGQGESGQVYKAYLKRTAGSELVAVKTGNDLFLSSEFERVAKKISTMLSFKHDNLISLIGVCADGETPLLIMPFMSVGSVLDYVRNNKGQLLRNDQVSKEEAQVTCKTLLQISLHIAKGMEYLSRHQFVHCNLAARNCMIDAEGVVKVADFGLTENMNVRQRKKAKHEEKVLIRWMAPETIENFVCTEATDVWSYGVTMWEIFTCGRVPYAGIHVMGLLSELKAGNRLEKPKNKACHNGVYNVMLSCWELEAKDRPKFSNLVVTASDLLEGDAGHPLKLSLPLTAQGPASPPPPPAQGPSSPPPPPAQGLASPPPPPAQRRAVPPPPPAQAEIELQDLAVVEHHMNADQYVQMQDARLQDNDQYAQLQEAQLQDHGQYAQLQEAQLQDNNQYAQLQDNDQFAQLQDDVLYARLQHNVQYSRLQHNIQYARLEHNT